MLRQWNEQINLVSRKSIDQSFGPHYADSLFICDFAGQYLKDDVHDIGTGAGFPGVIFAARYPEASVTLYEKSLKKQTFLAAVLTQLALPKLQLAGAVPEQRLSGLILARAVFPREELFAFMRAHLTPESILITNLGGRAEASSPPKDFSKIGEKQYRLPLQYGERKVEALRFRP